MEIKNLSGLKLFLTAYRIEVLVLSGGKLVTHGTNASMLRRLYQGAHWGPLKIVMPINASTVASGPGQSIAANVSIGFLADVWYDFPVYQSFPESGSKVIGTVLIANENSLGLLIIIIPPLLVIVAVLSVAYLKRGRFFGSRGLPSRHLDQGDLFFYRV